MKTRIITILLLLITYSSIALGQNQSSSMEFLHIYPLFYSQPDSAEEMVKAGIEKAIEANDYVLKAEGYSMMVYLRSQQGKYLEALEYINMAQTNLNEIRNEGYVHAYFYYVKSLFNIRIGNHSQAATQAIQSEKIYELLCDTQGLAKVYTLYSGIHFFNSDLDNCFANINKSMQINQKYGDNMRLAGNLGNMGSVYHHLKINDSALVYLKQAIEVNQNNNNLTWLGENHHTLGMIYIDLLRFDEALISFHQALDYYSRVDDQKGLCSLYRRMSDYFLKINRSDSAHIYIGKSIEISQSLNDSKEYIACLYTKA